MLSALRHTDHVLDSCGPAGIVDFPVEVKYDDRPVGQNITSSVIYGDATTSF
jgi:hypothetical protein